MRSEEGGVAEQHRLESALQCGGDSASPAQFFDVVLKQHRNGALCSENLFSNLLDLQDYCLPSESNRLFSATLSFDEWNPKYPQNSAA